MNLCCHSCGRFLAEVSSDFNAGSIRLKCQGCKGPVLFARQDGVLVASKPVSAAPSGPQQKAA